MIKLFEGDTADELWREAAEALVYGDDFLRQDSRSGPIREYLHCSFHLKNPIQRWILSRQPSINPAFAIAEVVWILQGRNDAAFPNYWNPKLPEFAGRGVTYSGAYGQRLRSNLGFDQIESAYQALAADPDSRQVVMQIWDGQKDMPNLDGTPRGPDIPCNVVAMLKVRGDKLEWLQIMRSNDIFRGTPHNIVQFTCLQEVMAGWLGLEVGSFVLITDSLHLYEHDVGEFYIAKAAPPAANTDSLSLPKNEFDQVLLAMGAAMDELRSEKLLPRRFMEVIANKNLPESWLNLLRIVAADAARRRNWKDEADTASSRCSNPALKTAWYAWLDRCKSRELNHLIPITKTS
ncbi:MAG: thymidylate synthase [Gallionellaceae bacterium]|jgi:thymidylate synthase